MQAFEGLIAKDHHQDQDQGLELEHKAKAKTKDLRYHGQGPGQGRGYALKDQGQELTSLRGTTQKLCTVASMSN